MMRKNLFIVSMALVVLSIVVIGINANSVSAQVEKDINAMMDEIILDAINNPQNATSSNPYDYIKDNEGYQRIIELGPEALPHLRKEIIDSSKSGLKEYLLAAAAEEIAKVKLKNVKNGWATAKEWVVVWDEHLQSIPQQVRNISASDENIDIKIQELTELGILAIPFIMDEIEQGNNDITPALDNLLIDNKIIPFDKQSIGDYKQWVNNNKGKFEYLRKIVDSIK